MPTSVLKTLSFVNSVSIISNSCVTILLSSVYSFFTGTDDEDEDFDLQRDLCYGQHYMCTFQNSFF